MTGLGSGRDYLVPEDMEYNYNAQYGGGASLPKSESGGSGMDPASAGLMVGGSFISSLMQAKAAEEAAKKAGLLQGLQSQKENEDKGINTLMQAWAQGLRGIR